MPSIDFLPGVNAAKIDPLSDNREIAPAGRSDIDPFVAAEYPIIRSFKPGTSGRRRTGPQFLGFPKNRNAYYNLG
jgi:hypothetical protein